MIRDLRVELVSPAMIGGAVKNDCDEPPTLRPPSLRGHLRFWSGALGGTELSDPLWGTTESGQKVRILLARSFGRGGRLAEPRLASLIPSRNFRTRMIPPGDTVLVRFAVPDAALLPRLQAVVWTWLHLGAVGRRSRRGFGSLRWQPSEGDLLSDWPPLWPSHHLTNGEALEEYLKVGLARVQKVLGVPGTEPRSGGHHDRLRTQDQVFVGKELAGRWDAVQGGGPTYTTAELESALHGLNERHRGDDPERLQLGSGQPRRPSPMMWRTFPVHGRSAVLPVMTWFPYGYEDGEIPRLDPDSGGGQGGLYDYLHGRLGFEYSLTGGALFHGDEIEPMDRSG